MKPTLLASALLVTLSSALLQADVTLPAVISDHMVLEKTARVPLWGKAAPGEKITITLDKQTVKTVADDDGKWSTALDLSNSAPGPFEMLVQGENEIRIKDVVVGEVWLASGQSNMQWTLNNTIGAEEEIAQSTNPLLREFAVKRSTSRQPLDDCEGQWVIASPETTSTFSAVAYYFGKTLQKELQTPVGLIHSSWGGTPSEAWTSEEALGTDPDLNKARENKLQALDNHPEERKAWVAAFGDWLKQTSRQDQPTQDVAPFATGPTDGWTQVEMPGDLAGVPKSGILWLRTTIDVPANKANQPLNLNLGPLEAFESIYWNGELIKQLAYQDYPGKGFARRWGGYAIPANKVKEGKNTFALRMYAPIPLEKIPAPFQFAGKKVPGPWFAKAEVEFPNLTKEQQASLPQPPTNQPGPQNLPAQLFNGMIHPLIPYAISGVIWYQGESNSGRAFQYRTAFPLLITDWRNQWKQGDFPFYFCQLANFQQKTSVPGDNNWAELREAQSMTLALPATGQAVLIDIGEVEDIHPRNKREVGERLARIALAKDYGKDIAFSGPVFDQIKIEGSTARLSFTHTDGGIVASPIPENHDVLSKENQTAPTVRNSPDSELEGFAICGADRNWVWADAKIDGETVVVSSPKVTEPVAVRYGWAINPTVNLSNGAGLPASPFRTDDFPAVTKDAKY